MKKILSAVFAASLLLASCSSNDDDEPNQPQETVEVFTLDATGTVAEQTAVEAKKTINGRWSIGSSASKTSAKAQNCSLNYIEFTDSMYAISILTPDGIEAAFGQYTMVETNGTVSAVELNVNVLGNNHLIATLTNIVVTETANNLIATFDVVFNIPADYEWACGSSLSGDYSAEKEEPLDEAEDATADSNFAKLVNTWRLAELYETGENGELVDVTEQINEVCDYDYDTYEESCEQGSLEVTFSAYGTYLFINYRANGEVADWGEGDWEFANSDQSELTLTEYEEYDGVVTEYENTMVITTLNDTEFSGTISNIDGEETYTQEFTFTIASN